MNINVQDVVDRINASLEQTTEVINSSLEELKAMLASQQNEIFLTQLALDKLEKQNEQENKQEKRQLRYLPPTTGDQYYYVGDDGQVYSDLYNVTNDTDNFRFRIGNFYYTQEEAEKVSDIKFTEARLYQFAHEIDPERLDWTNTKQQKYYINYDPSTGKLTQEIMKIYNKNVIYSTHENFLQMAIEEFGKQPLVDYITGAI